MSHILHLATFLQLGLMCRLKGSHSSGQGCFNKTGHLKETNMDQTRTALCDRNGPFVASDYRLESGASSSHTRCQKIFSNHHRLHTRTKNKICTNTHTPLEYTSCLSPTGSSGSFPTLLSHESNCKRAAQFSFTEPNFTCSYVYCKSLRIKARIRSWTSALIIGVRKVDFNGSSSAKSCSNADGWPGLTSSRTLRGFCHLQSLSSQLCNLLLFTCK